MNKLDINNSWIEFKDKGHVYTDLDTGDLLTGVSTILRTRHQDFMTFWPVKEMWRYLDKNWTPDTHFEEKTELLEKAKGAWVEVSKKGQEIGTEVHSWIEAYLKGEQVEPLSSEEAKNAVDSFIKWENDIKPEYLALELVVGSKTHKCAGTIDAVIKLDDKIYVVDFKTSNQLSENTYLQTAGYQLMLEEMGQKVDGRYSLRLPKTKSKYEFRSVPTPIEFDKEVFLYCRGLHRWNLYIENQIKK